MFHIYKGGRISYSDSGKGFPVILLHGYLESSEVWNGFEKNLAGSFRVISIDLPGHGLSDIYSHTHTMEFMATVVRDLLGSLDIKKAFLIGHSLGGYVALAFLELYPDYLSGYCLFHSQPFEDTPEAVEKRKREILIVEAGKKELMYPENVTKMYSTLNLEKFSEALRRSKDIAARIPDDGIVAVLEGMMQRPSRLSYMEEGKVPCLWILGESDNYIPHDQIQSRVKLPENASVVVLKNSGHMGFIEEQEKSLQVVKAFIEKSVRNFSSYTQ